MSSPLNRTNRNCIWDLKRVKSFGFFFYSDVHKWFRVECVLEKSTVERTRGKLSTFMFK